MIHCENFPIIFKTIIVIKGSQITIYITSVRFLYVTACNILSSFPHELAGREKVFRAELARRKNSLKCHKLLHKEIVLVMYIVLYYV